MTLARISTLLDRIKGLRDARVVTAPSKSLTGKRLWYALN